MTNNKTLLIGLVLVIIVIGGWGYIAMNTRSNRSSPDRAPQAVNQKSSITWQFKDEGETQGIPYTTVTTVINGQTYEAGTFAGSCTEIGESGGIDGKGLVAGELSAAQCWFGGGGNEIGVFAHEDGGFDIMAGDLSEGNESIGFFRGDFKVKSTIKL